MCVFKRFRQLFWWSWWCFEIKSTIFKIDQPFIFYFSAELFIDWGLFLGSILSRLFNIKIRYFFKIKVRFKKLGHFLIIKILMPEGDFLKIVVAIFCQDQTQLFKIEVIFLDFGGDFLRSREYSLSFRWHLSLITRFLNFKDFDHTFYQPLQSSSSRQPITLPTLLIKIKPKIRETFLDRTFLRNQNRDNTL